jgi:hypothetical protein
MDDNEPLLRVTEFFIEYKEAYKRLRRPSAEHDKDYENLTVRFDKYEKEHRK